MSEIDFDEIEKAMAELINKAQGKQREQDLERVTKARDQRAKETETDFNQGELATKRIIVAHSRMRSPEQKAKLNTPITPSLASMPQGPKHMDFISRVPATSHFSNSTQSPEELKEEQSLHKTVGELSREYLLEKVAEAPSESQATNEEYPEEYPEENFLQDNQDLEPTSDFSPEPETFLTEEPFEQNPDLQPDPEFQQDSNLQENEDLIGPASKLKSKIYTEEDAYQEESPTELEPEFGGIHKIYGQKLPKDLTPHKVKSYHREIEDLRPTKTKVKKDTKATFTLVAILSILALASWSLAAYLFFFV